MARINSISAMGPALLALVLLIAGMLSSPVPANPDSLIGAGTVIGAFSVFGFWVVCVGCWGRVAANVARISYCGLGSWIALGSVGAALSITALGHVGLIGPGHKTLLLLLLLSGTVLNSYLRTPQTSAISSRTLLGKVSRPALLVLAIVAFAVVTSILRASIPHFASDPLYYHLLGPRLWSDAGRIYFPERIPVVLLCSYWDALSIWGQSLLSGANGEGLVEGQLFAQWTHAAIGFGGTALLLAELFAEYSPDSLWRATAVLVGLSSTFLASLPWIAKSDWGLILWTLSGWRLLHSSASPTRATLLCAGACLGAAAGKPVTWLPIFFLVAFDATGRAWRERRFSKLAWLTVGIAGALSPLFVRNYAYTANPFFPISTPFFSNNWLSPSLQEVFRAVQHATLQERWHVMLARLKLWLPGDPLSVLLPLSLGLAAYFRKSDKLMRDACIPLLGCFTFLALIDASASLEDGTMRIRWLGPLLPLLLGFGVLMFAKVLAIRPVNKTAQVAIALLLAAIGCLTLPAPLTAVMAMWHAPNIALALREAPIGGDSKAWLRLNLKPGDAVLSTGDNQLYYLSQFKVSVVSEQPLLDSRTRELNNPAELACAFFNTGAHYAIDSHYFNNPFWSRQAYVLDGYLQTHPDAVVYRGRESRVIDLKRLVASQAQACGNDLKIAHFFDK